MLRGPLGKARFSLLKWLQDAMDPKQASTTRSKAVKALAAVMKADSRLLAYQEVQACVTSALKVQCHSALRWTNQTIRLCCSILRIGA